ncbi:MAG: hypothetical protein JNG88_03895 [Phycisphaerales bacterium]|nr:hypothetical protein [Phycisphaerales bacterium]
MRPTSIRAALTLFEVITATTLIILLLVTLLTFFWQSANVRSEAAKLADRVQVARQVLDHMATELRGCIGMEQVGFPVEQRLRGDRRSLTFMTTALPSSDQYKNYSLTDELPPAQHDLREVAYSLWIDAENTTEDGEPVVGGILRSEKRTLNQQVVEEGDPLVVRNDIWSHELGYLEFRYYDGVEWDTTWDITQGNSLPQLIKITVGFDSITQAELDDADLEERSLDDPDPYDPSRYSTIIRIPAADRFFGSRFQKVGKTMSSQLGVEGGP